MVSVFCRISMWYFGICQVFLRFCVPPPLSNVPLGSPSNRIRFPYNLVHLLYESSNLGVANGSSKTLGLAKFLSNFTGLAISFFEQLCASRSLVFYTKVSRSLDFLQCLRVSKSQLVGLYFLK